MKPELTGQRLGSGDPVDMPAPYSVRWCLTSDKEEPASDNLDDEVERGHLRHGPVDGGRDESTGCHAKERNRDREGNAFAQVGVDDGIDERASDGNPKPP